MTKGADKLIAENRQDIRRTAANFIEAAERGSIDLTFGRNTVEVAVSAEVYKRPLNDTLVPGHPDGSVHGPGRGAVGDQRGGWSLVTSSVNSADFTRDGRKAVRNALDGQNGGVRTAGIGTGTTDASTGDTALQTPTTTDANAAATKVNAEEARGVALFLFNDHANSGTEFGLYNTDGSLLCRVTVDDVNPTAEEEVKVVVTLSVSGSGVGDSVVTNEGEKAIANALHFPYLTVGLNKIALGTGTTDFSKSSSSLTSEEIRKTALRELDLESIRSKTKLYEAEPSTQPVTLSEMAVFDNASTPNMVWATTFTGEEKTDGVPLRATVGFKIE